MRLRLTIAGPGRSPTDVLVDGDGTDTVADLVAACSAAGVADLATGTAGEGALICSGQPLGPDHRLGVPPLLDGATVASTAAGHPGRPGHPGHPGPPGPPGRPGGPTGRPGSALSGAQLVVTGGPDCGRSRPLRVGSLTIGRDRGSGLPVDDPQLSRAHARLTVSAAGLRLEDLGSTNGTAVDGVRIVGERPVEPGGRIRLGRSRLAVRPVAVRPAPVVAPGDGTLRLSRTPRSRTPWSAPRLVRPSAPPTPRPTRIPWVAMLVPVPVCAVLALLWGPQMLAFALLGPVVTGGTAFGDRRSARRQHAADVLAHGAACAEVEASAAQALRAERLASDRQHPDPGEVLAIATGRSVRLWERARQDDDLVHVRIGTGTIRSAVEIGDAGGGPTRTPTLPDAPVVLDLGAVGVLGITGDPRRCAGAGRVLLGQLVTLGAPADLRVWVVDTGPEAGGWSWLDLLPHRTGAGLTAGATVDLLRGLVAERRAAGGAPGDAAGTHRWSDGGVDVVLVVDAAAVTDLPGLGDLLRDGPGAGVVAVVLDGPGRSTGSLPAQCRAVLTLGTDDDSLTGADLPALAGHADRTDAGGTGPDLSIDGVGRWWGERLSRALAPVRDAAVGANDVIAPTARLLELTGLSRADGTRGDGLEVTGGIDPAVLASRWGLRPGGEATTRSDRAATKDTGSRSGRLSAVIGATAEGPWRVDLVADGPHVLIGGTTGSGKSELLQTLVAGLALDHSPEDVAFVLIDYKGGAAFAECAGLPHTAGLVTDLDGHLAERALTSLGAELRRREAVLARHGASSIVDYRERGHHLDEALPHLVIVIDEFKMLVDELPAFVDGVVRLASLGRSLGLHVVLATQRPAGAVTPDIAANVNLRIALRVRDRADSEQILDSPLAARIAEDTPGRALASTGHGRLVEFQTARVTGSADGDRTPLQVRLVRRGGSTGAAQVSVPSGSTGSGTTTPLEHGAADLPDSRARPVSDLTAVVAAAREAVRHNGLVRPPSPWLPPLPSACAVTELPASAVGTVWGLTDVPQSQAQVPLCWPPDEPGGVALVGGPGSGRTTAVRTLVGALTEAPVPTDVHVIDGSTALASLAALRHVGTVAPVGDRDRVTRLLTRLAAEASRRLAEAAAVGHSSVAEWRRADPAAAPARLLLVVDGWERIADGADLGASSLADEIVSVLRDGIGADLHLLATGGRSLAVGRAATTFGTTYALGRLDPTDAALLGLGRGVSTGGPPGRAVDVATGLESQLAHLGSGPAHRDQLAAVATLAASAPPDGRPRPAPLHVPAMPTDVDAATLAPHAMLTFGLDADLAPVRLDPDVCGHRILVAGPRGSGRTTTLHTLAASSAAAGQAVALVTGAVTRQRLPSSAVTLIRLQDVGPLRELAEAGAALHLYVDDADGLAGAPVEQVLTDLVAAAGPGGPFVVGAADPATLVQQFRGVAVDLARARTGILLSPAGPLDGELFGVRVPRATHRLPGRGHLVVGGRATAVQVARATASVRLVEAGPR